MAFLRELLAISFIISRVFCNPVIVTADVKNDDEDKYRIPHIISDLTYNIRLTLPEESLTTAEQNSYDGNVQIRFRVTEATDVLKLHSSHDFITIKSITLNDIDVATEDYSVDEESDILAIDFTASGGLVTSRSYTLEINYDGKLSTEDMDGFYKSSYQDGEDTIYLATTQFEPTDARRALPCFDEPSIKGTFSLDLIIPEAFDAFSNTPVQSNTVEDGVRTVLFETTPQMSTYLLAFIVSDFECTSGEDVIGVDADHPIPTRVCARKSTDKLRAYAAEEGSKLLTVLNEFTGYNYGSQMGKMDQMAIPDFSAGAMENWGLVTYRERLLLIDPEESTNANKQSASTVIAHEFSHQWFGDLVTCDWWSELYLNEGFATYFEYHATALVHDDWDLERQFVPDVVQYALAADSYVSSKAIKSEANSPDECSAKFDDISYQKGGSVLRMVQHVLTLDQFKDGLGVYLRNRELKSAVSEELWTGLNKVENLPEGKKLSEVMDTWINKPGYPLITATLVNDTTISLSQQRFLVSNVASAGEDEDTKWYVPITFTTSVDENKFENTVPTDWLAPDADNLSLTIPEEADWVVLNNQQTGFYRVAYDSELLSRISKALADDDFGGIDEISRSQIIDDAFNLARAGLLSYSSVFDVVSYMHMETSYYSWHAAFSGFDFLLKRFGQSSAVGKAVQEHILRLTHMLLDEFSLSKTNRSNQIYTLNQVQALNWACKLGNTDCVNAATEAFGHFTDHGMKPDVNLRSTVYCNGLRYSDNAEDDWNAVWEKYLASDLSNEKVIYLNVLGCTTDAALLKAYLEKSIADNDDIRQQDASTAFTAVYTNNPEGIPVAFDFLVNNFEAISTKYQSMSALGRLVKGIADRFTTQTELDQLKEFVNKDGLPESLKLASEQALESAESNLQWLKTNEDAFYDYYKIPRSDGFRMKATVLAVLAGSLTAAALL